MTFEEFGGAKDILGISKSDAEKMSSKFGFELDDWQPRFILFSKCKDGDSDRKVHSSKDLEDGLALVDYIRKTYEGVNVDLETIDEWVHVRIDLIDNILVGEKLIAGFVFDENTPTDKLLDIYRQAYNSSKYNLDFEYKMEDYKKAYTEVEKILNSRGVKADI